MRTRVHLNIAGRVQGVCYRMCARDEALRLGLTGWVCNRPEGSVEAVAEGQADDVAVFVKWCRRGPPMAIVRDVKAVYDEPLDTFDTFRIAY